MCALTSASDCMSIHPRKVQTAPPGPVGVGGGRVVYVHAGCAPRMLVVMDFDERG
jgi:hypothetical protein